MSNNVPTEWPGDVDLSKFRQQAPITADDLKGLVARQNFIRSKSGSTILTYIFDEPWEVTTTTYTQTPSNASVSLARLWGAAKLYKPNLAEVRGVQFALYGRNIEGKITLDRWDSVSSVSAAVLSTNVIQSTSDSLWVDTKEYFGGQEESQLGGVAYEEPALLTLKLEARRSGGTTGYLFAVAIKEVTNDASDIANGTL